MGILQLPGLAGYQAFAVLQTNDYRYHNGQAKGYQLGTA